LHCFAWCALLHVVCRLLALLHVVCCLLALLHVVCCSLALLHVVCCLLALLRIVCTATRGVPFICTATRDVPFTCTATHGVHCYTWCALPRMVHSCMWYAVYLHCYMWCALLHVVCTATCHMFCVHLQRMAATHLARSIPVPGPACHDLNLHDGYRLPLFCGRGVCTMSGAIVAPILQKSLYCCFPLCSLPAFIAVFRFAPFLKSYFHA